MAGKVGQGGGWDGAEDWNKVAMGAVGGRRGDQDGWVGPEGMGSMGVAATKS